MIKDTVFKVLFIPLTGIVIPLYANLLDLCEHTENENIFSFLFFIISSSIIWSGVGKIINRIENKKNIKENFFLKLFLIGVLSLLYSVSVAGVVSLLWQQLMMKSIAFAPLQKYSLLYGGVALFIVPVYEFRFLHKKHNPKVSDIENGRVENNALKNEMDPHFIFNSLTALSHLIHTDSDKAYLFNSKLAQVYKYFLVNKNRDLISLQSELEFIEDYFFLLKIRHEEKLHLNIDLNIPDNEKSMVVPFALQVLIENAIKYNEFSDKNPLHILIAVHSHFINVQNNLKPKPYLIDSANAGLKKLNDRYKSLSMEISIENSPHQFAVKIPLIT